MTLLPVPADDELSADARAAAAAHLAARGGSLSNLDRTLLGHAPVFRAYEAWFSLRDELVPFIGERAVTLFSHAISSGSGARLPAAFFRREIVESGDDPDDPQVTETERLLLDWGRVLAAGPAPVAEEFAAQLRKTFNPKLRVLLLAFAGQQAAVDLFATAGGIPLDEALRPFAVGD